jgi:hypothetical protein
MTSIRDLARAKLAQLEAGQSAGHEAGQQVSHTPGSVPSRWDSSNPQESAKNLPLSHCPTPIGTGRRDTPLKSGTGAGTLGGTVGTISEAVAKARLREWHAHLTRLDHFTSPPGWSLNRWLNTVDAAMWLYEEFASQLVRDGWTAAGLFGVLPAYPGEGGLADRLGNARNLKLLDGVAHWRTPHGLHKQFPCGGGVDLAKGGLILLWEVSL